MSMKISTILMIVLAVLFFALVSAAISYASEPAWQLWQQVPGEDWRPRGKVLTASIACDLDLVSVAAVAEKGTRLACRRVLPRQP